MPKNRDTYDGTRKSPKLPAPNIYTGRAPADRTQVRPSAHSSAYAAAYAESKAAMHAAKNVAANSQAFSGERIGGAGGADSADGAVYEPSFQNAAIGASAAILKNTTRADEIADRLVAVLEQEASLYQDASDISAKKTDVIVHGKIEDLDSLVKAEQAIILKIGKLEDEREKIVAALSDELDMDLEGVTLSDINSRLGSESYSRLDVCQKTLAGTLNGLKNTNDMNAQLIQNALDYVNFSVNLLTTNQNSGNIYSQDGDDDAIQQRRNIFDVKL